MTFPNLNPIAPPLHTIVRLSFYTSQWGLKVNTVSMEYNPDHIQTKAVSTKMFRSH
jgi:hypothetical protein